MNCHHTAYKGIKRERTIFDELDPIEELRTGKSRIEYFKELMQEVPRTNEKPGPCEVRVNPKGRYYIHVTENSHPLDDLLHRIQKIKPLKHNKKMAYIETTEDLAEYIADLVGIYGGCKGDGEDGCLYTEEKPTCCRFGFVENIKERIFKAVENDKLIDQIK